MSQKRKAGGKKPSSRKTGRKVGKKTAKNTAKQPSPKGGRKRGGKKSGGKARSGAGKRSWIARGFRLALLLTGIGLGLLLPWTLWLDHLVTTESNFYNITIGGLTATTFTLTATPVPGSRQAGDAECTTLTLTNTGVKAGTGADPTECW